MLPRSEHRALQRTLNEAAGAIEDGREAWAAGSFSYDHVVKLRFAQTTLAQLLAEHDDRRCCLHEDTRLCMRFYEQIAADLLDAFVALQGDRHEELIRVRTGRIARRRLIINDCAYEHSVPCTNPAVGLLQLDAWEQNLRANLQVRMAA